MRQFFQDGKPCAEKVPYGSREEAHRALNYYQGRGSSVRSLYRCRCGCWHLTSCPR